MSTVPATPSPPESAPTLERDLLLGILALRMDFLARDHLVDALTAWSREQAQSIVQILVERGRLAPQQREILERIADNHGQEPETLEAPANLDTDTRALTFLGPDQPGSPAPVPAATGERYQVLGFHARGGLGEVYQARDLELGRTVALKEIQGRFVDDPSCRARFVREAEVTGKLEHPGIVPVYGLGRHPDGRPYYAMRFIQGASLQQVVRRFHEEGTAAPKFRSLAFRQLLSRFIDVCHAIDYAHSRGVLHRDLKPANIMLGRHGETLVVDWGQAKARRPDDGASRVEDRLLTPPSGDDPNETLPGQAVGTLGFMSPEQARGESERIGPATDVFGLGATLYAILTGRPAVGGSTPVEQLERSGRGEVVPPRSADSRIPKSLQAVCLKALAPQPDQRYGSARELAEEVERYLADEPVRAYREPAWLRASRWGRRHRTAVVAMVAVVIVAVGLLGAAYAREQSLNRRLDLALARSDRWLDQTMEVISDYYSGVGEDVLLGQKGLEGLREQLLAKPRAFYERFTAEADQRPDGPLEDRAIWRLARGLADLGRIEYMTGRWEQARGHFEKSRSLYERLTETDRDNPEYQVGLARADNNLGLLLLREAGDPRGAGEAHRRAIARYRQLTAAHPDVAKYQDELAFSYKYLGIAQFDIHDATGSVDSLRRSIEAYQRLIRSKPDTPVYRATLAFVQMYLGNALLRLKGDAAGAVESYEQAIATYQGLGEVPSLTSTIRGGLAQSYSSLATARQALGNAAGAAEMYQRTIELYEQLTHDQPNNPDYRQGAATVLLQLGELRRSLGQASAAIEALDRSIAMCDRLARDHPRVAVYRQGIAAGSLSLGQVHEYGDTAASVESYGRAIEEYRRLARAHPDVTEYRYGLAQGLVGLGAVRRNRDESAGAIEASREAIAIYQRLFDARPDIPAYQQGLAAGASDLAGAYQDVGNVADATHSAHRSIGLSEALVRKEPDIPAYRSLLGIGKLRLGKILYDGERAIEADGAFQQAVRQLRQAIRLAPSTSGFERSFLAHALAYRARTLLILGRPDDAVIVVRERRDLGLRDPEELLEIARDLTMCLPHILNPIRREEVAKEAVASIRAAIDAGWNRPSQLQADPKLSVLRRRRDFRTTLDALWDRGFPADPWNKSPMVP